MKYEYTCSEARIVAAFERDPVGFIINNRLRLESKFTGQGFVVKLEQSLPPFAYSAFTLRHDEIGSHGEHLPNCVKGLARESKQLFMVPALAIAESNLLTDISRPEAIKHDLIHHEDYFLKGAGITRRTEPHPLGTVHIYEMLIGDDNFYIAFLIRKEENLSRPNMVEVYILPAVISLLKQRREYKAA